LLLFQHETTNKDRLSGFSSNFSQAFIPVANYFKPIHAKLEHSAAHTRINPLIDLQTM